MKNVPKAGKPESIEELRAGQHRWSQRAKEKGACEAEAHGM